jgi:WD40 repeat protein
MTAFKQLPSALLLVGYTLLGIHGGVAAPGENLLPPPVLVLREMDGITCIALSPDGNSLALGTRAGHVSVRERSGGKEIRRLRPTTYPILSLAFCQDGQALLYGTASGPVHRTDLATGKTVAWLGARYGDCASLAFSGDGHTVALGERNARVVGLSDLPTRRSRLTLAGQRFFCSHLALSHDGATLASAGGDGARVWDGATGKLLRQSRLPQRANNLALSPDGKTLGLACVDGRLLLGPAARGGLQEFKLRWVTALAFSPDGRALALGLAQDVRIWEVATARERCAFRGHHRGVRAVAFAPDGKTLVSADGEGRALVWDLTRPANGGPARVAALPPDALHRLWSDLASDDAALAYRAACELAAAPGQAVPFLRGLLDPGPADARRIARLVADLGSPRFAVRDQAMRQLARLGEAAAPALKQTLADAPSREVRRRAELLLRPLQDPALGRERLRELRAFEALERVGGAEVCHFLEQLARGPAGWRTDEARATLQRLARRRQAQP